MSVAPIIATLEIRTILLIGAISIARLDSTVLGFVDQLVIFSVLASPVLFFISKSAAWGDGRSSDLILQYIYACSSINTNMACDRKLRDPYVRFLDICRSLALIRGFSSGEVDLEPHTDYVTIFLHDIDFETADSKFLGF